MKSTDLSTKTPLLFQKRPHRIPFKSRLQTATGILAVLLTLVGCVGKDNVTVSAGFIWFAFPEELSVNRGDQAQFLLQISTISGVPLPKRVKLSVTGLPQGAEGFFLSKEFFPPANILLFVKTSDTTPLGTFPLTISNNQSDETLSVQLIVEPFQWEPIVSSGTGPTGITGHSAVYDEDLDQMTVFGGEAPGGYSADLWRLQNASANAATPPQWEQISLTNGPSARSGHRAVYDRLMKRMMIWGGTDPDQAFVTDPLWVLVNADGIGGVPAWTQQTADNPPPDRIGFSMIYDPLTNRATLFGGAATVGGVTTWYNDVWVLTNANGTEVGNPAWIDMTPSTGNVPNPRLMHSAVYDSAGNRMIVFGGATATGGVSNDVWVLSYANGVGGTPVWQPLSLSGDSSPASRMGHTAVYDSATHQMIVFGGTNASGKVLDDLWLLEGANGSDGTATWGANVTFHTGKVPYPDARSGHTAVFNPSDNSMVVFGGTLENKLSNEAWILRHATGE
jgi:hypothetical protein